MVITHMYTHRMNCSEFLRTTVHSMNVKQNPQSGRVVTNTGGLTMSNAVKFHEDSWSTVAEATVATTPRMGGKKVQRTYRVCSVPSKKFVAKWLTVATLKGNVTTPLVEEVDGKYCLTTVGITELLNDLQTGMDVDFTGTNILVNFNKFINKHIGRFNSKYGASNDNIIDFAMSIVVLLNNNKDQLTRVSSIPTPQVKATKGSIDLSVL